MKDKKEPLKLALHGFNGKSYKQMIMFFAGHCKGMVVVTDGDEATADMIDMDAISSNTLLEGKVQKARSHGKSVIALSVTPINIDGVIYVSKPLQSAQLKEAIDKAINQQKNIKRAPDTKGKVGSSSNFSTSSHKAAMNIDETTISDFSNEPEHIELNIDKLLKCSYSAKHELQGILVSAIKHAKAKNQAMKLSFGWKPIIIIPFTDEIWMDVDDRQLKAYLSGNNDEKKASVAPIHLEENSLMESKLQPIENFMWKIAIWTSKGRYPAEIDLQTPVYLSRWPNMTRCIAVPHALRISALLIEEPKTLTDISKMLHVKHEYVFAFFSAAHAIGIAGQATKLAVDDGHKPKQAKTESKGLLGKIMNKLRGK